MEFNAEFLLEEISSRSETELEQSWKHGNLPLQNELELE